MSGEVKSFVCNIFYYIYNIAFSSEKVISSESGEKYAQLKHRIQAKTVLNKCKGGFWCESTTEDGLFQEALLWIMESHFRQKWHFKVKTSSNDGFVSQTFSFSPHKALADGLEWCGFNWSVSIKLIIWFWKKNELFESCLCFPDSIHYANTVYMKAYMAWRVQKWQNFKRMNFFKLYIHININIILSWIRIIKYEIL